MLNTLSPGPLSMRFNDWPETDKAAWTLDCIPTHPFDEAVPHYAATLRPASLYKAKQGYGRWLRFLETRGWLDHTLPAMERVTRRRLAAYLVHLKKTGNGNNTIIGRVQELHMALKILAPGQDVSWVRRPWGPTIYSLLSKKKRHLIVPDSGVLFRWGEQMMRDADAKSAPNTWRTTYRDGLLIAMLAARGRRRRSMHLLRIGAELIRNGDRYRIELTRDQTKTKADRFDLPECLTSYIERYLNVVRPMLAGNCPSDALWISRYGAPLSVGGLTTRIVRLSKKRFGVSFGTHRFRHAIATTIALRVSYRPGLAAAVLNISEQIAGEHYIRAGQFEASLTYAELVKQRARTYRAM